ncbi:MliC family protein [Pseudoxanthomonas sp. SE1]|uniref:MliC family protein n=1 Tax=Pseudoxanthomonas sp. SE1 TaxID=1664560 RepID=UPI00240D7B99|nr:MliC family protein [Pseudoxanthomonas sp. SE1]WFC42197.1 MliC family protein [Pseudoxanthomonas sp. SE1]
MKSPLLCLPLFLLAACAPESPAPADTAPAAPESAATEAPAATVTRPDTAPALAPPSFDCAKAASEAEKLVCTDAELAALDRQLAARYVEAKGADPAVQRGWVKGRDECWKADDARLCVLESYRTRLVELAIHAPGVVVPKAVEYRCDDNSKPFTMTYYNDLDPQAAVMTWGNDQAIVFPQPAASGARYGRSGIEYREHQGEARVDFFGNKLSCRPVP